MKYEIYGNKKPYIINLISVSTSHNFLPPPTPRPPRGVFLTLSRPFFPIPAETEFEGA